jgi:hypothetical protein
LKQAMNLTASNTAKNGQNPPNYLLNIARCYLLKFARCLTS